MGKLALTNQVILGYGKRGKLLYDTSKEAGRKIPGVNQQGVSYQDTDGKNKWVPVETDEYGGILHGGKRFANAQDLVSSLMTPTPAPPVTQPKAAPPTAPPPVNLSTAFPVTEPVRAVANYAGKTLSGVGAAFANAAGYVVGLADNKRLADIDAWSARTDAAGKRYFEAEDEETKAKAYESLQYAISRLNLARRQPETAKKAQEKLYGVSDKLAETSKQFQEAAERKVPEVLKPVLNVATDLVPFFVLNSIPVAGQAAAGAYLVGESTGEARRAGLSETSQAALGLASLLSMGAAGQVGKALGSKEVAGWFLANGKGPEFARVLERAAASGLAIGLTRQAVSMGGQAALGVYREQVQMAQANLDALAKIDVSGYPENWRTAHESAVKANQAIVNSGGADFTAALGAIAVETILSIAGATISYGVTHGWNFTARSEEGPLTPEKSVYFKGVTTPEEAKQRRNELSRKYHPDISEEANATEIMAKINDEYERLGAWMKAHTGKRAQSVTDAWTKAKSGQGVTKAEADAANNAVVGLLQSVREDGNAGSVTALETILAPMAAEINTAAAPVPVAPSAAPVAPQAPASVAPQVSAPVAQTPVPVVPPQSAQTQKPFITFEQWQKLRPESVASADAAARERLSALTAEPSAPVAQGPSQPTAPVAQSPAPIAETPAQNETAVTKNGGMEDVIQADTSLFPHEILKNFNQARLYFVEYAKKNFPAFAINKETGKAIGISRKGIDKFLSGNILFEKYASGFYIPALIKNGHKTGEANNYHPETVDSIPTFEYYESPIVIDGKEHMTYIRVKNTDMGDKYYGHTISELDDIKIESPTRTSVPKKSAVQPENTGDSTSNNSIPQSASKGKGETEISDAAPVQTETAPLQELIDGLNQYDRVEVGGLRFEIRRGSVSGKDYALAQIRRVDPQETPYIQNAANDVWRDFLPTPEAARDALISVARTIPAFSQSAPVDNSAPSGYAVPETGAQTAPANSKEVVANERRGENRSGEPETGVEARDGGGVLQSPGVGPVVSQLGGALDAGNVPTPEGAGETGGAVLPVGRRDNGHPVGELQRAGNVGRSGNREGTVHEQSGSGLTEDSAAPEKTETPSPAKPDGKRRSAKRGAATRGQSPDAKPESPVRAGTEETAAPQKAETAQPETPKEREKAEIQRKTEQAANPKGKDFSFPEGGLQLPNGEKSRAKANIAAIEISRKLESEGRPATAEEQDALSKFVGWGGLSNIFDESKPEWAALRGQLKEMLSDEEYAAAKKSTLNAHYTSQEVIEGVYDALEHLGFKGGRLLEPSAGIGHFNGAMPANLRGKSRWTMVELDPVTGGIAKLLYPNADVRVQGFENALLPDDYFDAAISNVPFGDIRIFDNHYKPYQTRSIHNYFFVKAMDKVRPGGVVAFVTSRYTMDSTQAGAVRRYLATKADLLGAVRLPDDAFKSNAGTEAVTDILIFKKRPPNTPYGGEQFAETNYRNIAGKSGYANGNVNEYFTKHPEMVLGTPDRGTMYGNGDSLTWKPKETDKSLKEQIREAFATVTGSMDYPTTRTREELQAEMRKAAAKGKVGGLVRKDGKIYRNDDGKLAEAADVPKNALAEVGDILTLRDAARASLDFQQNGASEQQIQNSRKGLNALYDDFVKKYGPLHLPKNQRLVKLDLEAPFINSLENYDKNTKTATKADLFSKNTVAPNVRASHADTVEDALSVSLNETGTVDAKRIAELVGETPEAVTKSLSERGLVFLNRDGNLETAEQYLSGNVRAKLKDAEALAAGNPDYRRNVEALKAIIPADIEPENIRVQIGATWVPAEAYAGFAAEMVGNDHRAIRVTYNKSLGEYRVEIPNSWVRNQIKNSVGNKTKWGTPDKTFLEIYSAILNNKDLKVWRKTADGSRILDADATEAVKQKAKEIQVEFQDWLFREPERRKAIARLFNDVHNNSVTPRYDGSKLTIQGLNVATNLELRPHPKDDIQRIVMSGGNTLIARKVGAGKTLIMAGAAMKLRQLGICRKPMIIAPKGLVGQWGKEFLDYFPAAKILVPGDDFTAAKRKEYVSRIATGDYDAVILSYEQFKSIPMSAESQAEFIKEQIHELEATIETEKAEGRKSSVKQTEKRKANLEAKLKALMEKGKDENNVTFEGTGVDALFVDEAHNFKNLAYTTHLDNVAGMGDKKGRDRPFDLLMKIRYLQRLNGGRGVVLATATPVMNSVPELYIMQLYLQPDELTARGIYNFDAWQKQFAVVNEEPRISADGKSVKFKQTLSRFNNVQTLQQAMGGFMTPTEAPGLKVPKMRGGKRIVVKCEPSEFQRDYMDSLGERAEAVHARSVKPEVDNMLKIEADGRKICYSQRVMEPSLPYEPNGKIMKCSRNVFEEWKNSEGIRGTQIIFCDFSTPKSGGASRKRKGKPADVIEVEGKVVEDSGDAEELTEETALTTETAEEAALAVQEDAQAIQIYHDMKNIMVGMGIPSNEIAFIHDAKTQEQRNQLFDNMKSGKIRVLMGSTGKMGVGMNAQDRVVALHHMDAPHRPGDIEQREGRALRQGNMNDEVAVYTYATDGTLDALLYDRILMKQTFIDQLTSADFTGNSFEFGENELSYGEIKAAASGNPLIQEQSELSKDIARLEGLQRAHRRETFAAQDQLKNARAAIAADTETADKLKADIATRQDTSGKAFSVTLDGKVIAERKAAGEALIKLAQKILKPGQSPEATKQVGTFAGFDLLTTSGGELVLRGRGQYRATVNFTSPTGTVQSLEAAARKLDNMLSATESRLKTNRDAVPELEKASAAPFAQAAELEQKRKRSAEILVELSDERKPSGMDAPAKAETSAFREAWDIEENGESGVLKFRERQSAKMESHPERWTAERVGDPNKKPLSVREVIEKYRRGWGFDKQDFHVTAGHVRGARGQYQKRETGIGSGGIRLKVSNDLPVFTHELGHALDEKYQITKTLRDAVRSVGTVTLSKEEQETTNRRLRAHRELVSNLDPAFAAQYKDNQLVGEGFAEFIRRLCQDRMKAAVDYPEAYRFLMTTLTGEDQARLLAMADEVNAVYSLDDKTAQSSIRRMDEKSPDYRGMSEKFHTNVDRFLQATVDSLHSVKKVSQMMGSDVYKKFYNAAYADSIAYFNLTEDLRDLDGQYVGPSLRTVLQGVNCNDAAEYDAFGEYLVVRNAPSWIKDDKRVLPNDRKNNVLYCEVRQKELEGQYPQFKEASERLYDFWDKFMRTYVVNTGLISQEQYDAMREKHPYYVPFNRVMDDVKGFGTRRTFANQPNPVKRAKGSGRDIIHPIDSMINAVAKLTYQGVHQRAMLDLIDVADAYGLDAAFMERVPTPVVKQSADISGIKAQIAERVGASDLPREDVEELLKILDEQQDVLEWYSQRKYLDKDCIGVRRNGELEVYKVNDPLLFDALANMGRPQLSKLLQPVNKATRLVSSMITGWNITWSLFSNAPRDLVTALVYSTPEHRLKLLPKIAGSYLDAVAKARNAPNVNPLYLEYLALGGGQASAWGVDTKLPKKVLSEIQGPANATQRVLDALKTPLKAIEFVSRTVEAGPRFATYEMFREDGADPQTAFRAAMEITVDFRKGSKISRALNAFAPFYNAGVQGNAKNIEAAIGADVPKKGRGTVIRGRLITLLVASLIGAAIQCAINLSSEKRRKSYSRLSTYIKNSYHCIPKDDGTYWTIPKARGLEIPENAFRAAIEYSIGENRHAFDNFWGYAAYALT